MHVTVFSTAAQVVRSANLGESAIPSLFRDARLSQRVASDRCLESSCASNVPIG